MALKDKSKWQGTVTLIRQKDGKIIEQVTYHNIATNYALGCMAQLLTGSVAGTNGAFTLPSYIELGTGVPTPPATDTASTDADLFAPTSPRTTENLSIIQTWLNTVAQYSSTWQSGLDPTISWTEAGLKDSNGNLWAHVVINPTIVNLGELLTVQWQIQFVAVSD
jgi:hypothetical protein